MTDQPDTTNLTDLAATITVLVGGVLYDYANAAHVMTRALENIRRGEPGLAAAGLRGWLDKSPSVRLRLDAALPRTSGGDTEPMG